MTTTDSSRSGWSGTPHSPPSPSQNGESGRHRRLGVVRLRPRSALALGLASLAGLLMFAWPLLVEPGAEFAHNSDAPFIFVLILPALIAVVLAELSEGGMDTKAIAMLGVLAAIGAALRPLGAGTAGIETVFFLLILAGRVYGPGFGFVLGSVTLFASALITGGVGPWLPFQMLAASWVGLGAGLLPAARGKKEIAMLAAYGAFSAYAFGLLMNLWFWPYTLDAGTQLGYHAGAPLLENLHRFLVYTVVTSTFGWDTGRAITNVLAICIIGPSVLAVLRRATRRAAFDEPIEFTGPEPIDPGRAARG